MSDNTQTLLASTIILSERLSPGITSDGPVHGVPEPKPAAEALKGILSKTELEEKFKENPRSVFSRWSVWKNTAPIPDAIEAKCGLVQSIILAHKYGLHLRISPEDITQSIDLQVQNRGSEHGDKNGGPKQVENHQCQESKAILHKEFTGCGIQSITLVGSKKGFKRTYKKLRDQFNAEERNRLTVPIQGQSQPKFDANLIQFLSHAKEAADFMVNSFGREKDPLIVEMWKQLIEGGGDDPLSGWFAIYCNIDEPGNVLQRGFYKKAGAGLESPAILATQLNGPPINPTTGAAFKPKPPKGWQEGYLRSWQIRDMKDFVKNSLPIGYRHYHNKKPIVDEEVEDDASDKTITATIIRGSPGVAFMKMKHLQDGSETNTETYQTVQAFTGRFPI